MNVYLSETLDLVGVTLKDKLTGVVVTTNLMYAVVPNGKRPRDVTDPWVAPVVIGARSGVLVQNLAPGIYTVFVKFTSNPLAPVEEAGQFQVT